MTNPEQGRDEALQEFLDGGIDETELRRRLGHPGDPAGPAPGLERDLAAYRIIWRALARRPDSRLPSDFARRTARAALAERRARAGDRWMGALVAASASAAAAAAASALGILIAGSGLVGVPAGLTDALATAGEVPCALGGTAGVAAVLFALDRLLSAGSHRLAHPTSGARGR